MFAHAEGPPSDEHRMLVGASIEQVGWLDLARLRSARACDGTVQDYLW